MSLQEKDGTPLGEIPHTSKSPDDPTPISTLCKHSPQYHTHIANNGNDSTRRHLQADKPACPPSHPQSLAYEVLFVALICSAMLLTQAGLAQSILPQHIIGRFFSIDAQPGKLSWFSASYSLAVGTLILPAGRLGDVLGHKRLFVGGFAWFGLWSALAGCAAYSGPTLFAVCRAMQGVGPALLLPNAVALLTLAYAPGLRQNLVLSLFGATAPGGFCVGASFASLLAERAWWPWAYWAMCFACVLLAGLGVWVLPAAEQRRGLEQERASVWQRIDIYGCVTGVASLVLFNFAWNQGPVVGWSTPYTYVIMILGILMFVLFVVIEKRVRYPLIPFGVLKIDSCFTLACISAGWSSFGIYIFYSLTFLEVERGQTPLLTSAQLSPAAVSGLFAAVTTGVALTYCRPSTAMLISMTAFLAGGIIFATMPVHQTYWAQMFVGIFILPWGMDMSFPAATIILSRAMPREHQGLAASLVNTFVNYSISIGLGFAGTVDSQVNEGGKNVLRGYRGAFYMGVGFSSLGVVVALFFSFMERYRSRPSEKTEQETG